MEKDKYKDQEEVFSKVLRAGNRSYFFDVKKTRNDDLYLVITESKKKFKESGRYYFEKHKVFLYKEDFDDFKDYLSDALDFAKENNAHLTSIEKHQSEDILENMDEISEVDVKKTIEKEIVNLEFEDLKR